MSAVIPTDKCSLRPSSQKLFAAVRDHYQKPQSIKLQNCGAQLPQLYLQCLIFLNMDLIDSARLVASECQNLPVATPALELQKGALWYLAFLWALVVLVLGHKTLPQQSHLPRPGFRTSLHS